MVKLQGSVIPVVAAFLAGSPIHFYQLQLSKPASLLLCQIALVGQVTRLVLTFTRAEFTLPATQRFVTHNALH